MIAFTMVGPCRRVDTNAVLGDGAAAEGWLPHRLDPATDTDPKDAGHVFAQGVPGLPNQAIEYAVHHIDAATLRTLGAERAKAGLVELDQESLDAMTDVDLPEIPGFPKVPTWPALLRLCSAQPPAGQAAAHPIVAEALAVMDERQVDRMRTETLAAAMHLTVSELKAKMRAAGVTDPTPIGKVDGYENPRGYKRDMLTSA
jgi:S-DNA-T family DNA segregation ATPase FtsK/SpoIIIE